MASATAVQSPHKCMSACIEQNSPSLVIPPRIAFSAIESMSCRRIQFFVDGSISTLKRSEEHTSELQSLMRNSYAVFCLKKKKNRNKHICTHTQTHARLSPYIYYIPTII